MCHERDRHNHGRKDFESSDMRPDEGRHRDREEWRKDNPMDGLRALLFEIGEEAFLELVAEKVKSRMREKLGERIDKLAEAVADRFVSQREAELALARDEQMFDERLEKILRKK